jgi:hypothetical protein
MIDPSSQQTLKAAIADCISQDRNVLNELREEIRPLRARSRRIQPRATTSISVVGTDGGNNQLQFDPFLVQLIRVVDSSNNEYCLEAISPTTPLEVLDMRQLEPDGSPRTALGEMMSFLGVSSLQHLSHMIRPGPSGAPRSPSWVNVYRELVEWATLFKLLHKDFGTDTLIVFDGFLRSKVFAHDLFQRLLRGMEEQINRQRERNHRQIFLSGVAKHSKVLDRYRLAMALEEVLQTDYPTFVDVPRDVEAKAYVWTEYARGNDNLEDGGETNKFVGGKMFLVKFGSRKGDPIWPIDIFVPQCSQAPLVLGSMLADAIDGFPVPLYPRSLQKAHENAALVDFDLDVLQDFIYEGVRSNLGQQGEVLDAFQLKDPDPSQKRYG